MKRVSGSEFEALIAWIQECIHDQVKVESNRKVKDVDTGKLRQIDISLTLTDGPTEFFAIIEVRDHKRPIGVGYVEEVSDKRRAVKADSAFLVSRSGFTKTAIVKADKLGIRTLTYDEATKFDWSPWFQLKTVTVYERKYENAILTFAEYGSKRIMSISQVIREVFKNDKNAKVLKFQDRNPHFSLPDLINRIVNSMSEQIYKEIPQDGTRQKRLLLIDENKVIPPLYIENKQGDFVELV